MAIFHPSYLLRNHSMDEGSPRRLMYQDLVEIKTKILGGKIPENKEHKETQQSLHDLMFGELTMMK